MTMHVTRSSFFVLLACAHLAFGCSSSSSSAPAPVADARPSDETATGEDSAIADGADPADTATPADTTTAQDTRTAADTSSAQDTAAACHTLVDASAGNTITFEEGPPPTAAGGQLMVGTYVLTSAIQYGGSYIPEGAYGTLRISTSTIERAVKQVRTTEEYSTSGDTIFTSPTCGGGTPTSAGMKYTATSTTFVEYVPHFGGTKVLTYTKS